MKWSRTGIKGTYLWVAILVVSNDPLILSPKYFSKVCVRRRAKNLAKNLEIMSSDVQHSQIGFRVVVLIPSRCMRFWCKVWYIEKGLDCHIFLEKLLDLWLNLLCFRIDLPGICRSLPAFFVTAGRVGSGKGKAQYKAF